MVDYGTSVGTLTSNTVTQYVREVVPLPSTNVYSDGMASFTITCEFYGDESSTEVWKKGNVDVSNVDGADIGTVTSYAEYKITVPLIIDPLTLTAFEAVYTCSATYTAGSASKEAMIDVKKLSKLFLKATFRVFFSLFHFLIVFVIIWNPSYLIFEIF